MHCVINQNFCNFNELYATEKQFNKDICFLSKYRYIYCVSLIICLTVPIYVFVTNLVNENESSVMTMLNMNNWTWPLTRKSRSKNCRQYKITDGFMTGLKNGIITELTTTVPFVVENYHKAGRICSLAW
jgi:hypothetical protein